MQPAPLTSFMVDQNKTYWIWIFAKTKINMDCAMYNFVLITCFN